MTIAIHLIIPRTNISNQRKLRESKALLNVSILGYNLSVRYRQCNKQVQQVHLFGYFLFPYYPEAKS
jgi:hypothetical protein